MSPRLELCYWVFFLKNSLEGDSIMYPAQKIHLENSSQPRSANAFLVLGGGAGRGGWGGGQRESSREPANSGGEL